MIPETIKSDIQNFIGQKITNAKSLSGGSIANAQAITFADGNKLFLKFGSFAKKTFKSEAIGLKELAKTQVIRIPEIINVTKDYLLLEHIEQGMPDNNFHSSFGKQLANLHKYTSDQYGFHSDNFIGTTPQINTYKNSWASFYFENRLLFQYKLLEEKKLASKELTKLISLLENKIDTIIGNAEEPPCLIHGDLWVGNYLIDKYSKPVLIDPAVCYAHRELDLSMTMLFGEFPQSFYKSYNQTYPLQEGWEERIDIYKLYHTLNHYNIFGGGYGNQSIEILKKYLT